MGHDIMLSVSYQNLGHLLAQLRESVTVQATPELAEKVRNAILFHQQLAREYEDLWQEHQTLKQKLSQVTRDPGEIVCGDPHPARFSKYEQMRDAGMMMRDVYWAAKQEGLDKIELIAMLRQVFQLSLRDAQSAIVEAERLELRAA
jgi:hypothetical protein